MKKKILVFMMVISILVFTGCGKNKNDGNIPTIVTPEVTFEGLKIKNFSILYENNMSTINADIENTTKEAVEVNTIEIKLYDKDNNLIETTYGYIGETLDANQTDSFSTNITSDVTNTKRIECNIVK